tara:strand:- start:351 stop:482 length:132 start_codon:yes stop_codon:yes gene_type:complete
MEKGLIFKQKSAFSFKLNVWDWIWLGEMSEYFDVKRNNKTAEE